MTPANSDQRRAGFGAMLTVGVGLILLLTPLGAGLVGGSFDVPLLLRPRTAPEQLSGVVIVYMDERSFQVLEQRDGQAWDRALHAQLLNRLKGEQCRLVVLDV